MIERVTKFSRLAVVAALTLYFVRCASESPQAIKGGAASNPAKATTGSSTSTDSSGGGDDSSNSDSGSTSGGGGADIETIIKQCGVTTAQLQDPTSVILEKEVSSYPKTFAGTFSKIIISGTYVVNIKLKIKIHATIASTSQTTDFEVTGSPSQAVQQANDTVQAQKGTSVSTSLTTQERADLMGKNKDWSGIVCTIGPTKQLEVTRGGKKKTLTFDPPLPGSISPKADPARYQAEIGQGRTFNNITMTVSESFDPAVPPGQTFQGTVKVTPITPKLTLTTGAASQTVTTDMAYKVETDFGGPAQTAKLGLLPSAIYFISNKERDLKIIVADTQDPQMGTVVLSDSL